MTITPFSISLYFSLLFYLLILPLSLINTYCLGKNHTPPLCHHPPLTRAISALAPSSLSTPRPGALDVCPPQCRHPRSAPKVQHRRPTLGRVVARLDAAIRALPLSSSASPSTIILLALAPSLGILWSLDK